MHAEKKQKHNLKGHIERKKCAANNGALSNKRKYSLLTHRGTMQTNRNKAVWFAVLFEKKSKRFRC